MAIPEPTVATTTDDWLVARTFLQEYGASIKATVCAQGFEEECKTLELTYKPPAGCFLILRTRTKAAGCVGLKPCGSGICELTRLYVRPDCRRRGLGKRLVEEAVSAARAMDCVAIRLYTLPTMTAARALYQAMGFVPMPSEIHNPDREDVAMELRLTAGT